mmetsp:Transcript_25755/g.58937  ORF Transcript_25755/g.58937 Transcript_25755/m.58937 type:complete len:218 (-) Transcript_25755:131-784(-)
MRLLPRAAPRPRPIDRPHHVERPLVPPHRQDAHGLRQQQADRAQPHPQAARLGCGGGDAPRPLAAAALLQVGRLGVHLQLRQAHSSPVHREWRCVQLRRRGGGGRARRQLLRSDGREGGARQAVDLHRDQRAAPLGHLVFRTARHAQVVRHVWARALGHRRPRRVAGAQLLTRVAILPAPLCACRLARKASGQTAGSASCVLWPQRSGNSDGFGQRS